MLATISGGLFTVIIVGGGCLIAFLAAALGGRGL